MNLPGALRRNLGLKLALSYIVVIVLGGLVLVSTAELVMPAAFERHLAAMADAMPADNAMAQDLFDSFRQALHEAGLLAMLASMILAVGLSLYISLRVMAPIRSMSRATQRIANGHYQERVALDVLKNSDNPLRDLDELGRLALDFNRMASALERTEKRRQELIGNVAHELRTPLTSIMGYMEGMADGVLPADAATFERVHREADRLQRLVRDLQELSRIEEGAVTLNLQPTTLEPLVEAVIERLRPQFQADEIKILLDLPADLPPVRADADRLTQVLLNLVGNALRYTPAGRTVRLQARQEQQAIRISVIDQGIGIGPEDLPHIFERFYRAERSRARESGGTGVGLTIAQHLVRAQGGEIVAASEGLDRGSTFSFTLPLA